MGGNNKRNLVLGSMITSPTSNREKGHGGLERGPHVSHLLHQKKKKILKITKKKKKIKDGSGIK